MPLTSPLSLQIYSGRMFPPLEAQLATAARCGFSNIETFGPLHDEPALTRRLLDRHGLTARSGHFSLEAIESQAERVRAAALELGIEIVVAPYLAAEQRPTDRDGWSALGQRLARARDLFAADGLRFAWHNHDFEFAVLPDGSYPIEHVLGADLLWEADLAWVVRGNADPTAWLARYRGRIPLVHVKDIAPAGEKLDEDGWADVGAGALPWRALWPQCVAVGAEIMIAEHDNPADFERFARVSAAAMRDFVSGAQT
jgi:sugar phosphate isomerase/epimerase